MCNIKGGIAIGGLVTGNHVPELDNQNKGVS